MLFYKCLPQILHKFVNYIPNKTKTCYNTFLFIYQRAVCSLNRKDCWLKSIKISQYISQFKTEGSLNHVVHIIIPILSESATKYDIWKDP